MKDEFRISEEERDRLVANDIENFPVDNPKYTTYLLNPAINLSQSNRPRVVGQMSDIVEEFRKENPDGTFEDWVEFYYNEYDGEERLNEAMTHDYLRDLVLFKSYEGFDIEETILRKLGELYDAEISKATAEDESKGIDGYIGEQPVQVKPVSYKDNLQEQISVPIVFYDENKSNKAMTVDISKLNEAMGE